MKKIMLLLFVALFLAAPVLAEVNIGVVDMRKAIEESDIGKATQASLEKEKKAFEQDMKQLEGKLKDFAEEYRTQAEMLKPGARADKEREYDQKVMEAQKLEQERGMKLQRKIQGQLATLQDSFVKIANELSKKEGYDFVFERSNMIYAIDSVDFTDKVTAEANKTLKP
jgi:outer membrane protein